MVSCIVSSARLSLLHQDSVCEAKICLFSIFMFETCLINCDMVMLYDAIVAMS